ncbi:Proteinase inhibitor I42, chagasin [Methanobacterium lacus]|uniref:Proteinase inhibitor I42, chagasin n=1 Tax=Methanobacterium lacus (strain AL-21) TaxID=877455 RepID=F0T9C5_METLA|nr:protease inhibitor I42 family protein [Methanobacterium lacus]ADZ09876.1 Proteinase inhibitor I42, chagasin [Methanobacterium lacus]
MNHTKNFFGLLIAFMCLAMISGSSAANPDTKNIDQGGAFPCYKLTINLVCNPSTGYMWVPEFNSSEVKWINDSYIDGSGLIGEDKLEQFVFVGVTGAKVVMKLENPNKQVVAIKTYKIPGFFFDY